MRQARALAATCALGLLVWPNVGYADPPSPASFDGWYATIGPVAGASRVADAWFSAVGLELSVVRVDESVFPAALGIAGGGVSYAGRDGGRLWLEVEAGLAGPIPVGIGLGAAAEVDRIQAPRLGAQATLWLYAGLVPYVRVGTVKTTGSYLELGAMLKIPVRFLY
jgi:hypothetical protein